jgi:hypothetical protein
MIFDNLRQCRWGKYGQIPEFFPGLPLFHLGEEADALNLTDPLIPNTPEECRALGEDFFLPFAHTSIEDSKSCILLGRHPILDQAAFEMIRLQKSRFSDEDFDKFISRARPTQESAEKPAGLLTHAYSFTELFQLNPQIRRVDGLRMFELRGGMPQVYEHNSMASQVLAVLKTRKRPEDLAIFIRTATILPIRVHHPFRIESMVLGGVEFLVDPTGVLIEQRGSETALDDLLSNFQAAVLQVAAINSPLNIVVEKAYSEHALQRGRNGKQTTFLHKRKRLIVLPRKTAYRVVTGDTSEESDSRASHVRRRHWRTLRSEVFTKKQGERIQVKECWVGPKERVEGNTRYTVRLDIGLAAHGAPEQRIPDKESLMPVVV